MISKITNYKIYSNVQQTMMIRQKQAKIIVRNKQLISGTYTTIIILQQKLRVQMEFKKTNILIFAAVILSCIAIGNCIKVVKSFKQLGQHHCELFPIQDLWRVATGALSQKYGQQYFDYDCYIRQFIRKDGLTIEQSEDVHQQDEDEQQQQSQDQQTQKQLQIDPIVAQYAQGLSQCLPSNVNSVQATYAIWRFFRFIVQNDYIYQWMRAKIRATLGYQAQRPNSWMDGQNSAARLRLDKLFSNQFYQYVDKLMFKDFLYPLLRFFKQNTVIGLTGKATQSGKPIIFQNLQTFNYLPKVFEPVVLETETGSKIFSYTIPGLPLLFAGSNQEIAWSFTGVLVDRTNIQEIQTVGNKFYHHDTEEWLKLDNQQLVIPGVDNKTCKFMHCTYGTLYTKQDREGKNEQYIIRWHEKQSKVRMLFSGLYKLINNHGILPQGQTFEFPFNSIVIANETGIFQYICQQFYPSYFLYPDMFGQPQKIASRWFAYPNKKVVVVSNSRLTTTKQQSYSKGQPQSSIDEQVLSSFKILKDKKFTAKSLLNFGKQIATTQQLKKQKQIMVKIYRKVKFFYLPEQEHRKKCDLLISILQKWDNNLNNKKIAPIYILWDYFLKQYTFNYISASKFGGDIVKHKLLTDNYWLNQMILWEKGTSYGECDSDEYQRMKDDVNGTGHNSSCYLNILRAINTTKQILTEKYNGDFSKIHLDDFVSKQYLINVESNFKGDYVQQAFGVYYSRNLMFAAQVGNPHITYYESYLQKQNQVNLSEIKTEPRQQVPAKAQENELDEQL